MTFLPNLASKFLILTAVLILLPIETYAFGAGDIPDFSYLNDKAFRHGDIENVLEELAKTAGGAALGGGIMGIASSVLQQVTGGSKFTKSDIKKVYFGNWLRDYSQAMDIAGLGKLTADTLVLVVAVLGFMAFGFSTQEFEVTAARLGVYLPVEHIDNPKGYAQKEGDARRFHPKLRPPVQPQELEIDQRTGMKKYMATENQGWDTSTAFIRRTFRSCIEAGRRARGNEGPDLWEAYRLLGTGLHTMEDLLAHSNWCEIALRKLGYKDVFCHVGDNVYVNTPNGRSPPLVTGTFGSADFLHSLLGEAGDKLSQASVTDLSAKLNNASQGSNKRPDLGLLKDIFKKVGGGDEQKLNQGEAMQQQSQAYQFNPDNMAPAEVQQRLLDILKWHDDVMRDIIKKIEIVPGLSNLLEEFSNALNEYIYTVIAPYIGPVLTCATGALDEGSKVVIDNEDQYEVFDNPNAHDPSHSLLSKDHFGLILNEPAGKIAIVVVKHTVNLIVQAWSDNSDPNDVINRILEAFHHPFYATGRSEIQNRMFDEMRRWVGGMEAAQETIQSLSKDAVRNHRNKRKGLDDMQEPGYGGCHNKPSSYTTPSRVTAGGYGGSNTSYGGNEGYQTSTSKQSYPTAYGGKTGSYVQSGGHSQSQRREEDYGSGGNRNDKDAKYGSQGGYDKDSYSGDSRNDRGGGYGGSGNRQQGGYIQRQHEDTSYTAAYDSGQRRDDTAYSTGRPGYGGQHTSPPSSGNTGYDGDRRHETCEGGNKTGYGGQQTSYGSSKTGGRREESDEGRHGYNRPQENIGYGGRQRRDDDDRGAGYGGGRTDYGRRDELNKAYGGNSGYGQSQSSGYAPSYSQTDNSNKDNDDNRRRGYGKKDREQDSSDDDKKKYRRPGQESYGPSKKDTDDEDDEDRKYHGKPKDRSRDEDRNKGHGYGGDTYGAERLNIGDREDYNGGKKKQYRGGY